jgi:hypothetical protein
LDDESPNIPKTVSQALEETVALALLDGDTFVVGVGVGIVARFVLNVLSLFIALAGFGALG